jgi:hypothetical protein
MKKGTRKIRIREDTQLANERLVSDLFRLNPTESGHKNFLPPLLSLLPPVKCFQIRATASAKANPWLKISSQIVLPQQLPTLANSCHRGIRPPLSPTLNSLSLNLRRARSCPIVGGARRSARAPTSAATSGAPYQPCFIRVHPCKSVAKNQNVPNQPHPLRLRVSAVIPAPPVHTPNFLLFHPCTQPRATAKLST